MTLTSTALPPNGGLSLGQADMGEEMFKQGKALRFWY